MSYRTDSGEEMDNEEFFKNLDSKINNYKEDFNKKISSLKSDINNVDEDIKKITKNIISIDTKTVKRAAEIESVINSLKSDFIDTKKSIANIENMFNSFTDFYRQTIKMTDSTNEQLRKLISERLDSTNRGFDSLDREISSVRKIDIPNLTQKISELSKEKSIKELSIQIDNIPNDLLKDASPLASKEQLNSFQKEMQNKLFHMQKEISSTSASAKHNFWTTILSSFLVAGSIIGAMFLLDDKKSNYQPENTSSIDLLLSRTY